MLLEFKIVYKVMKKVGKLSEARMVKPAEPKFYPIVSDDLFEGAVKGYASMGIKGGTKAAAKEAARRKKLKEDEVPKPDDLASNRPPQASLSTTNRGPAVNPRTYQVGNQMTDAKDSNWIQGAEADIKRRGTEGKCTPITKKSCTGRAKALAKTFKKMAKKRDAEVVSKKERAAKRGKATMKKETVTPQGQTTDNQGKKVFHPKSPELQKRQAEREKQAAAYKASMN